MKFAEITTDTKFIYAAYLIYIGTVKSKSGKRWFLPNKMDKSATPDSSLWIGIANEYPNNLRNWYVPNCWRVHAILKMFICCRHIDTMQSFLSDRLATRAQPFSFRPATRSVSDSNGLFHWEHYQFVNKISWLKWNLSSFILFENLIVGSIIYRTSNSKHGVSRFFNPPCPGTFHSCMTDKFIRRFNASATNRITAYLITAVMYFFPVVVKSSLV